MVTNNVEHTLLKSRTFRRRPGDVPYPVEHIGAACSALYVASLSVFPALISNTPYLSDVWSNMSRTRGRNPTLHKFESPPAAVLDLGCGSGCWAIEAAKAWPNSVVVGFDVKDIQPKLLHSLTREHHSDIAHRVKWVHGNLLDGLPFHCDRFDFVRMVNIGLGVPEDEWQYVLEARVKTFLEAARVLKPGGVIEVIEEDPIFPCEVRQPLWAANHGNSSMTLVNRSPSIVNRSPSTLATSSPLIRSDPSSVTLDERCEPTEPSPNNLSSSTIPYLPAKPPNSTYPASHTVHDSPKTPKRPTTPTDRSSDLQDHSRLKAAWDALLASRFIAEKPLSVLPFYLSSLFVDVQSMPPVKVLLPPNSNIDQPSPVRSAPEPFFNGAVFAKPPPLVRTSSESTCSTTTTLTPSALSRTSSGDSIDSYTTEFAQMHLASTVHTVTGCKEAIWQEYKNLYDVKNVAKVVSPNAYAPSGYTVSPGPGNVKSSIRESFDDEWAAWHNDMTDRIGMRALMAQSNWSEPPGQRPDWQVWRAKVQQINENKGSSDALMSGKHPPALCRSMRGFIGRKSRL
ncbi:hypothetical protein C0995_000035 [Termitomyces sp. Mi166|nr:hypothetical protein C0995_000035 [Termitomyces sp. Mi166\